MLLFFFRRYSLLTPLVFLLTGVVLWGDRLLVAKLPDLLSEEAQNAFQVFFYSDDHLIGPLYRLLLPVIETSQVVAYVLAACMVLIQAVLFNRILTSQGMFDRHSFLPALVYLVMMSSSTTMMSLHPLILAQFFLLIALQLSFSSFDEKESMLRVFDAGLMVGLAALFYLPALIFWVWIVLALLVFYIIDIRSLLASVTGLLLPFALAMAMWFISSDAQTIQKGLPMSLPDLSLPRPGALSLWQTLLFFFSLVLVLFSIFRLRFMHLRDKPIRLRRRFSVLIYFFLTASVTVVFPETVSACHLSFIVLPASAFVAFTFRQTPLFRISEVLFSLWVILIFAARYF